MRHICDPLDHNARAYEDRDPNAVTQESIQVLQKTKLAPQPVQPPETASYAFNFAFGASNVFAIHYDNTEATTGELDQQSQYSKLGPGHPQSYQPSGLAAQPRVAKPNSNTSIRIPMPHMEFNPYLAIWV